MPDRKQIALIGLGNPGPQYEMTRHNAGFWLADRLADRNGADYRIESKFFGALARFRIADTDVLVLKPATFMNRSGQAASAIARFFKLTPEQILVAHDELDLPIGVSRLKRGGGHGGHNGLRDIHKPLGSEYLRLRIGVGHPGDKQLVMSYLTQARPGKAEFEQISLSLERACDAIEHWINAGWDKAVQTLHSPV